ncbi:MAG TPA: prepilin-type N-terminal cleavage/methylation domain-containing protein [Rariglobus sp.]
MKIRGFTLVELLAVVAILGILAGLVIGVIGRAKETANSAKCASNLHQIGIGLLAYASDHKGMITGRSYAEEFKPDGTSTFSHWYRRLGRGGYVDKSNQLGDSPIFYCPSFPPTAPTDDSVDDPENVFYRYGMRNWVPPDGSIPLNDETRLLPLNSIENPADFFLVADSIYTTTQTQGYSIPQGSTTWGIHLRHNGKANTLFADGHVAAMDADYFNKLYLRQFYGGATNGKPFLVVPK